MRMPTRLVHLITNIKNVRVNYYQKRIDTKLGSLLSLLAELEERLFSFRETEQHAFLSSSFEILGGTLEQLNARLGCQDMERLVSWDCYLDEALLRIRSALKTPETCLSYQRNQSRGRASCYFCSSPIFIRGSHRISAMCEDKRIQVLGCALCTHHMKQRAKANILHFSKEKGRIHWRTCPTYSPTIEYWNINDIWDNPAAQERTHNTEGKSDV